MDESLYVLPVEERLRALQEDYDEVKANLKNILQSVKFCGICLASGKEYFYMLDFAVLPVNGNITLEHMVLEIFREQMACEIPSMYICNECTEAVKRSYLFISKVKNNAFIVNQLLLQINTQMEELDSLTDSAKNDMCNVIIGVEYEPCHMTKKEQMKKEFVEASAETKFVMCDYCARSFKTKQALKRHIDKNHLIEEHTCLAVKCEECLSTPCIHEKYLTSIQEQKSAGYSLLQCPDCDFHCSSGPDMIAHVNREHLDLSPYLCETCGKSFPSRKSHNVHMRKFHIVNRHICQYCDRKFGREDVLHSHLKECQSVTRDYACKLCPASFNSNERYQLHHRKHVNNYQCNMCTKSCDNNSTLLRHKMSVHEIVIKPLKRRRPADRACSVCPAKCANRADLKKHLKTHGPNEKHKCELCDRKFKSRKAFLGHCNSYSHLLRLDPTTNFNFACPYCDKSYPSAVMLENHRNLTHLKIKPYVCQTCNKSFSTDIHLKRHLQVHEGIRKFQCSDCSVMLTALSSLKKHVLRHHSEKKPYSCDMCDESFVCNSEKLKHTLQKHSEPKIACPICDLKFSHRSNTRSHIYKVHLKDKNLQEFLREHKHNKELVEFMRDRRIHSVEN